jgi:predicted acyl esterase
MKHTTAICLNSAFFGFYAHAGFIKGISELNFKPALDYTDCRPVDHEPTKECA